VTKLVIVMTMAVGLLIMSAAHAAWETLANPADVYSEIWRQMKPKICKSVPQDEIAILPYSGSNHDRSPYVSLKDRTNHELYFADYNQAAMWSEVFVQLDSTDRKIVRYTLNQHGLENVSSLVEDPKFEEKIIVSATCWQ
jgi:hypothetical protein